MFEDAYDFRRFYKTRHGKAIEATIAAHVHDRWRDVKGETIVGFGFCGPYLAGFAPNNTVLNVMPETLGAYHWPDQGANRVAVVDEKAWPLPGNSVDRVVMVHGLEYSGRISPILSEAWRVLKSQGRLIAIVPNRTGWWARTDWAPFGHGRPFLSVQLERALRASYFVPEHTRHILYRLPFRSRVLARIAPFLEKYGRFVIPALAGLHMIEAGKQLYSGLSVPVTEKAAAAARLRPADALR